MDMLPVGSMSDVGKTSGESRRFGEGDYSTASMTLDALMTA